MIKLFKRFKRKKEPVNIYNFLNHLGEIVYTCYDSKRANKIMQEVVASEELFDYTTKLPDGWYERIYGFNIERSSYYTLLFKEGE